MKILCAWCRKKGNPALIGEREPRQDKTEADGLCPEHWREVETQLKALWNEFDEDAERKGQDRFFEALKRLRGPSG